MSLTVFEIKELLKQAPRTYIKTVRMLQRDELESIAAYSYGLYRAARMNEKGSSAVIGVLLMVVLCVMMAAIIAGIALSQNDFEGIHNTYEWIMAGGR